MKWSPVAVIGLLVFLTLILFAKNHQHRPPPSPTPSPPPQVTLAWDPNVNTGNPDTDTTGYMLCLGFSPGNEPQQIDAGPAIAWTVQLSSATTYYFVVRAYNAQRITSLPSNEVSFTTP